MVFHILIAKILAAVAAAAVLLFSASIHTVHEGHVGVYWRGGALLNETTDPGFHIRIPLVTGFQEVQVTVQTDEVRGIPCGTSGGVLIHFEKVMICIKRQRFLYRCRICLFAIGCKIDSTYSIARIRTDR